MSEFEGEELGNWEQDRCYVPQLFCKRSFNIVPVLWAVIGSSAAFVLGIRADLALAVAGALLALDTFVPSAFGAKAAI